jgi:hypothetical protein
MIVRSTVYFWRATRLPGESTYCIQQSSVLSFIEGVSDFPSDWFCYMFD